MEFAMKTVSLYRPIENAMSDFNRYLESFFESPLASLTAGDRTNIPAVDVQETDNSYVVEAELPGFEEKNIQVHVDGGRLTIESLRDEESEKAEKGGQKQDKNYLIKERRHMEFSRSFKLPENADTESVEAVFKNGILSLEIKKQAESARKRLIKIESR
jgi:HSP20 family protein